MPPPAALQELLSRASACGLPATSLGPDGNLRNLAADWRAACEAADVDAQIPILDLMSRLDGFRDTARSPRGAVFVEITLDRQSAALIVLGTGKAPPPGLAELRSELAREGVAHGVDDGRLEACARALQEWAGGAGSLLRAPVAQGTPASPGKEPHPRFEVPVFPLYRFRDGRPWEGMELMGFEIVKPGALLGVLEQGAPGVPGRDVLGKPTATPPRPPVPLTERISVDARSRLVARAEGLLVRAGEAWDIVPLFSVRGNYRADSGPLQFPGIVAIEGSCRGAQIEADDLLVGGDLSGGQVRVRGDIHVAGRITGGAESLLSADGMLTAGAIESATVEVLGDVCVRRAIVNAHVTALGRVAVLEGLGEIAGGTVAAFRGVEAPVVGSDFGVPTSVLAGRDFLTSSRLKAVLDRLALHEENLRKIDVLKERLASARVGLRNLPPDKQDVYLGVLKKEEGSRRELASLERQRGRFRQACADFLGATVRVAGTLHPSVSVEIAGVLKKIQERLHAVVLAREGDAITANPFSKGGGPP